MCHILANNPDAFRDWQYERYQQSLSEDYETDPISCNICGDIIPLGEEVYLGKRYTCEGCIDSEMEENGVSREVAIESLTALSKHR